MKGKRVRRGVLSIILIVILVLVTPGSELFGNLGVAKAADETTIGNAGFETDIWGDSKVWNSNADDWDNGHINHNNYSDSDGITIPADGGEKFVNVYANTSGVVFTFSQDISLKKGKYTFSVSGMGSDVQYYISVGETNGDSVDASGWNNWADAKVDYTADEDVSSIKLSVVITATADGGWGDIDCVSYTYEDINDDSQDSTEEVSDGELKNGDFESTDTAWTISGGPFYDTDIYASNNTTQDK